MGKNNNYLWRFNLPIAKYSNSNMFARAELQEREKKFNEENAELELDQYMIKAESEFGTEVKYLERYYNFKHLKGIYDMLYFFVILTIISIIVSAIVLISELSK